MSVATDQDRAQRLLAQIESIEAVAETLDQADERRAQLMTAAENLVVMVGPMRPVVAASILGISERTVRTWAREGLLKAAGTTPTLSLDPLRVHEVMHIVRDLRAAGRDRSLLDAVWPRLGHEAPGAGRSVGKP